METTTTTDEEVELTIRRLQGWEPIPQGASGPWGIVAIADWGIGPSAAPSFGETETSYRGTVRRLEHARPGIDQPWRATWGDGMSFHDTLLEAMDAVEAGLGDAGS